MNNQDITVNQVADISGNNEARLVKVAKEIGAHRHCKHVKRIGLLRSGRVLRYVLQTFPEEDPFGFHDPARSLFNFFQRKAATIRGSVMEIHSASGRAAAASQVTVTLYRGVLGTSDLQKVETFRTGIDGLYHFENIPKGEYTIHVQDPNVKEPNWGPAAYRRASVADDNAVIELDPTVIDYK
jgi:hypothetical protein